MGKNKEFQLQEHFIRIQEILIFDEATNSLDEKTELDIINSILSLKNKTIIFITHNRNLVSYFDKVYDLDN